MLLNFSFPKQYMLFVKNTFHVQIPYIILYEGEMCFSFRDRSNLNKPLTVKQVHSTDVSAINAYLVVEPEHPELKK